MNNTFSKKKIIEDAQSYFDKGNYYCSEAIVASIRDNIDNDMPKELIAAASGFPVGIGKTKCTCGAISGGVICIGYFFGRCEPTSPTDPKSVKTLELAAEIQDYFRSKHKVSCCSILTKEFDMAKKEHKPQCVMFTGEIAGKVAEIIARELNLKLEE